MLTRRNVFLTLGVTALALAVAIPAAFSRGPGGREGKGRHMERMVERLGLDAAQAQRLEAIKIDHFEDAGSLHEQMRTKREAMQALWLAPSPNKQQILAAEREIGALEQQLAENRVEFLFAAKAILTPEQFGKLVEMRKHHGGKHGPRGGKHGWRGGKHGHDKQPAPEDSEQ